MLRKSVWMSCLVLGFAGWSTARAEVTAGRNLEDRETFTIGLTVGQAFGLDGEVREISRPIEDIGAKPATPPENYSWEELGFDDSFGGYGLFVENMWKYVTFQGHFFNGKPELNGVADRDYYLGVEEVDFEGREYEYMKIPEGQAYDGEIDLYTLDLALRITPVSFGSADYVEFVPWLHLGAFIFIGQYDIDAGPPQGVVQYENPPRDYVVGGQAEGTSGLVIPEYGFGGEFRFYVNDRTHLSVQGTLSALKLKGSTADFGISSRNEKDLDIDYLSANIRVMVEFMINDDLDLVTGIDFQTWDGDATAKATDKSEDEILELREKFDKDITFTMSSIAGLVGLRF